MSRRVRQGIKDIEKDITDFERTVQKVKAGKNKPVDHHIKQRKPFVTEPIKEGIPRLGQKSNKQKLESQEIHKQVLENKNATVVITVRTKHSHVSKKRSKINVSPCRSKGDVRPIRKEGSKTSHSAVISKEDASVNKDREANVLPWSSLLNNRQFDYETCSSIYSGCYQPNNIQSERSTTESKYVYKKNCSTFSQRHDFELKTRVDQSVQCAVPHCECGKFNSIGELKSLFTDVLSTLQKSQGKDNNMERNLNKQKSFEEDEPVRLPRSNDTPKRNAGFTPVHPAKASPPTVISAPVPRLPMEVKTDTTSSSPGSMQKQLEVTNLLLEQTYREIALKCEEYRKERDQLRQEVIQQQRKVQALMEKEKDHLMVISSLQADIHSKTNKLQHQFQETSKVESPVVGRRNSELEIELQLLRLQSEKYQTLMASKEKEIARFKQELQSIQAVIQEQLENCKLIHFKVTSDDGSSDRKEGKPVCSSPTSSAVTLGTLESWQKISCISPSTVVGDESDMGVVLGEKLAVPDVKRSSPKHETFHSIIQEAAAAISDTGPMKKVRKELSEVFEEIRNSRLPLPSPPRTYTDLNDSHWTDLSAETLKTGASFNDTGFTQATGDKL